MSLIEWTRLEPGQVEALVAMFVNRERMGSTRITPSRGDGGVDILDRGAGPTGGDVVYQVKRYTDGFSTSQKASVKDSWDTLRSDPRWDDLRVEEWHLVMPLDPSPEAELWLQDLAKDSGVSATWRGLGFVEQLAAKFPDVVDYYLKGGATRIREAQAEVLTLMGLDNVGTATSTQEVTERVQRALGVLDHDPHYRFEFRFGEGPLPTPPADRPGLVLHTAQGTRDGGRWITVDVIARCVASADVEPITINGRFEAEPGTELAKAIQEFYEYGAPVHAEDAFTGELTAPAGLGGELTSATVQIGTAINTDLGDNPAMHLDILGPDDTVLASVDMDRTERSQGLDGSGIRVVLREVNGIFELEERWNLTQQTESRHIRSGDITGLPVRVAVPGIQFLTELKSPNRIRISSRHTAPGRGVVDEHTDFGWDQEQVGGLAAVRRILEVLNVIQDHVGTVIRVPDFPKVDPGQFQAWRFAAAMLQGRELTATIPEGQALTFDLDSEIEVEDSVAVSLPWEVTIDDQVIDLGRYEVLLDEPTLVHRAPVAGGFSHTFTTKDNRIKQRRASATT
ncbi:PDDEXK family nuclease [Nocardioides mangrovicus]|nr:restriction endonuclease [Nocardioides mangrovicus]